jgi:hypothetical protein
MYKLTHHHSGLYTSLLHRKNLQDLVKVKLRTQRNGDVGIIDKENIVGSLYHDARRVLNKPE